MLRRVGPLTALVIVVSGCASGGGAGSSASAGATSTPLATATPTVLVPSEVPSSTGQPSVDEAGTLDLALTGLGTAYVEQPAASGDCSTVENSQAIGTVDAANLGTLQGYRVTASLGLGPVGSGDLTVDIGAESFPQGVATPSWEGQVSITADAEDLAGNASFAIGQTPGPYKPGMPTPPPAVVPGGWPATLVGTLSWHCSGQPIPSAAPPISGSLSITSPGLDWTAPPAGSPATCDADGITGPIGILQGYSFSGSIDFRSSLLMIGMDLLPNKELPPGLPYLPNWVGQGTLSMPSDWHAGTASFTDLPTGVDPRAGPPPAGWPPTLTGTLTWSCGS